MNRIKRLIVNCKQSVTGANVASKYVCRPDCSYGSHFYTCSLWWVESV